MLYIHGQSTKLNSILKLEYIFFAPWSEPQIKPIPLEWTEINKKGPKVRIFSTNQNVFCSDLFFATVLTLTSLVVMPLIQNFRSLFWRSVCLARYQKCVPLIFKINYYNVSERLYILSCLFLSSCSAVTCVDSKCLTCWHIANTLNHSFSWRQATCHWTAPEFKKLLI